MGELRARQLMGRRVSLQPADSNGQQLVVIPTAVRWAEDGHTLTVLGRTEEGDVGFLVDDAAGEPRKRPYYRIG